MSSLIASVNYIETVNEVTMLGALRDAQQHNVKAVFILCCDNADEDLSFFNQCLAEFDIPIFGGVFPGLLSDGKVYEKGALIVGFAVDVNVSLHANMQNAAEQEFSPTINLDCPSIMVLVDGLANNIDYMTQQIFHLVGHGANVFGGGAGSLSFEQKPCIICNQGIFADALLMISLDQPFELAIGHGWEKLAGPFLASQAQGNQINSLNFQSALSVYQNVVSQHTELDFNSTPFFEIAKTFPFGIERLDDDMLVRDPITTEQQSLICVGNIPENTMLYILHGEADKLISAASNSVKTALSIGVQNREFGDGILFDCISRKLFLTGDYLNELTAIQDNFSSGTHLVGVLALGEIASGKAGMVNFHNKTAVTGLSYRNKNSD